MDDCDFSKDCKNAGTDECNQCTRWDWKHHCPSKYPCPFKEFSMNGMKCTRDRYPHLIIFCSLKELRNYMTDQAYAELIKKIESGQTKCG